MPPKEKQFGITWLKKCQRSEPQKMDRKQAVKRLMRRLI